MKIRDSRKKNWFWVENFLLEKKGIDIYEKMIYVALCRFVDAEGRCFPSLSTLAAAAGCSKRKASDAIAQLIEKKMIAKKNRKSPLGDATSNVYIIYSVCEGGIAPCAIPHAQGAIPVLHPVQPKKTQMEENTTTTSVVVFETLQKFSKFKDSIRIPLNEIAINRIMMSHRCSEADLYAAADILDFQSRAGSNIIDYRKYLISLIKAIQRGTLGIPDGYQPPWERAEKARLKKEKEKKEKDEAREIEKEVEMARLSPKEIERLKAKDCPALVASRQDDDDEDVRFMAGGIL
jgi:hypothetical protein